MLASEASACASCRRYRGWSEGNGGEGYDCRHHVSIIQGAAGMIPCKKWQSKLSVRGLPVWGWRNVELFADAPSRWILDFAMAGDRSLCSVRRIPHDCMRPIVANNYAAMAGEMSHELSAFHLTAPVSKRALSGINSWKTAFGSLARGLGIGSGFRSSR